MTGFTGSFLGSVTPGIDVYGSVIFASGATYGINCQMKMTFRATDAQTISRVTSGAIFSNIPFTFDGVGGSWTVNDTLSCTSGNRAYTLTNGSLTFAAAMVPGSFSSSNSNVRTLNLGTAFTHQFVGNGTYWDLTTTTNLTFDPGTSTIRVLGNYGTTLTFSGGGLTYYNIDLRGISTDTFAFVGNNTFSDFKMNNAVPRTVKFTAGSVTSAKTWTISGTAGNLNVIGSLTAASHTLQALVGKINVDYINISRSDASPANWMFAGANSNDGLNNTGWIFTAYTFDKVSAMMTVF